MIYSVYVVPVKISLLYIKPGNFRTGIVSNWQSPVYFELCRSYRNNHNQLLFKITVPLCNDSPKYVHVNVYIIRIEVKWT